MARPSSIVKNPLSIAIGDLRRRLGHSQQSFAQLLSLSVGSVARWELNQRPDHKHLARLVNLARENDWEDLRRDLYRAYRREFLLGPDEVALAADVTLRVRYFIQLADEAIRSRGPKQKKALEDLMKALHRLDEDASGIIDEYAGYAEHNPDRASTPKPKGTKP
jgi:transcriptional regulator with XRE-family HTH domain